jgi:hypothetical protein
LGIKSDWQNNVFTALQGIGVDIEPIQHETYTLFLCNKKTVINLVSLHNNYHAAELIELQCVYQHKNIYLVQVWEDVWQSRKDQVLGRISSILGLNKRLHARKAKIIVIDQKQADDFLNVNHIQASARAKYKLALTMDGQIVAVACFSNIRSMKRISADYRSVELIRFATLIGYTITGGFSKLIKHFVKTIEPNDIMSYADRDWSLGNAYKQSGFKLIEATPPAQIWLNKRDLTRYFPHRLPAAVIPSMDENFLSVYNTGNLKYILYL